MEYHTDIKKWWHTGRQDGSNKHASKGKKKKITKDSEICPHKHGRKKIQKQCVKNLINEESKDKIW